MTSMCLHVASGVKFCGVLVVLHFLTYKNCLSEMARMISQSPSQVFWQS